MNHNLRRRTSCRLCASEALKLVLPIRPSPIGDAFVAADRLTEKQDLYPLDCYLCEDCGHLQNVDIVDPELLFREYTYKTSVSHGLVQHFIQYAHQAVTEFNISENSLVVEIGSNDGSLLKAFKAHGMRVVGVDPAREIAAGATASGVLTFAQFFDEQVAAEIKRTYGSASIVCANNVFAHIDNMGEVAAGISNLLANDGVFIAEVSYIVDMIDKMVFDTIYHEHVSHHALIPLDQFLRKHDLTIFDVKRVPTKGGSIRIFVQRLSTGCRQKSECYHALISEEIHRRILFPEVYYEWSDEIEKRRRAVIDYLDGARAAGKKIAGYGASTTTTTLLFHFGLQNYVEMIFDDNPLKHGMFSPGAHIPVLPSAMLTTSGVDVVVVLAWIYSEQIAERNREFMNRGGIFLVPLPDLRVLSKR